MTPTLRQRATRILPTGANGCVWDDPNARDAALAWNVMDLGGLTLLILASGCSLRGFHEQDLCDLLENSRIRN